MKQYLYMTGIVFGLFCGCELTATRPKEVVHVYDWTPLCAVQLMAASFTEAKVDPDVVPDLVPDPDAAKCPCKGTGIITHGDGHTTECPYHGAETKPDKPEKPAEPDKPAKLDAPHKCRCDTSNTYCNCKKAYGKCSCEPRKSAADTGSSSCVDCAAESAVPERPRGLGGLFYRLFGGR